MDKVSGRLDRHRSHMKPSISMSCLPSHKDRSITRDMSLYYMAGMNNWAGSGTEGGDNIYSTTTTGDTFYAGDYAGDDWTQFPSIVTTYPNYPNINNERQVTKGMRTLFKVYVVDPRKNGKLLSEETVIADNENQAMLKAGVATVAIQANLELEQVDVYVDEIGTFIRPRKETQKVRVVDKDD